MMSLHVHYNIVTMLHTSNTALMHPSFSGLLVTWAYLPASIKRAK